MNPVLSAALRAALFVLGSAATLMPRRLELVAGPLLGLALLALDFKRRHVALENIRRCLPELGEEGARALLKRNYEHYGTLVFELLHLFSPVPGHYRRFAQATMRLEGYENWKAVHDRGKGVLFVGSHLGNWEMAAAAGGLHDMDLTMVTRRTKPDWLRARLEAARGELGVREAYDPRTMPIVLKALRRGESVGFVVDQYAHPPAGIPVRFFGVLVNTLAAVGPLASRTGAGILPVTTERLGDGTVRVRIEPELRIDQLDDPRAATQALAGKVEAWIRVKPEQWLWVHRRFKNVAAPAAA